MERVLKKTRLPNWLQLAAVIAASLASIATSMSPLVQYAGWQVRGHTEASFVGLEARAWVSKSGKTGCGLTVKFTAPDGYRAPVVIEDAVFVVGTKDANETRAKELPIKVEIDSSQEGYAYLPFLFDNNRAWNDNHRKGRISLRLVIDGQFIKTWVLDVEHVMRDYCHNTDYSPDPEAPGPSCSHQTPPIRNAHENQDGVSND